MADAADDAAEQVYAIMPSGVSQLQAGCQRCRHIVFKDAAVL